MSSTDIKLLIRADANPRIGSEFVKRGFALARAWKSLGGRTSFVCGQLPNLLEKKILDEGFKLVSIGSSNCDGADAIDTKEIQFAESPDWTVLFGNRFSNNYLTTLRNSQTKLMVVADQGTSSLQAADIIVSHSSPSNTESSPFLHQEFLSDPKYCLLTDSRDNESEEKPIVAQARKILISMVDADQDSFLNVARTIARSKIKNLVIDSFSGAERSNTEPLRELKKKLDVNIRCHQNGERLNELASRADVAVTSEISTAMKMIRSGLPTILLGTSKQTCVSKSLTSLGVIEPYDMEATFDSNSFLKTFRRLANNVERRRKMSQRGKQVVDGRGAARISRRLASELFNLREATLSDSRQLLDWRNEPEYRALTFSPEPIQPRVHQHWLEEKINSSNSIVWIAEDKNQTPTGTIAVDLDNQSANISICLCPSKRGRGLGPVLINKATRKLFATYDLAQVLAQIKPGNTASQAAFKKAGFRPIAPTTLDGATAMQMVLEQDLAQADMEPLSFRKSA